MKNKFTCPKCKVEIDFTLQPVYPSPKSKPTDPEPCGFTPPLDITCP